jgi:hypothetical protein
MSDSLQPQFAEVLTLIKTAQQEVIATANQELIKLYWSVGKYISDRLANGDKKRSSHSVTFYIVFNQLTHEIKRSPVTLVWIAICRCGTLFNFGKNRK